MSESQFPSGPWTGFYNYSPRDKHRMDLHLQFGEGVMTGEGNDDVGPFVIRGQYNSTSLECSWQKTYVGRHDVHYRGFREGKGIWGTWEISPRSHGGFQIWPRQTGNGEEQAEAAKREKPVAEKVAEPAVLPADKTTPGRRLSPGQT